MKRTVRAGVFETNSSSMHSIVVTTEDGENPFDVVDDWNPKKYPVWEDDIKFGRSPFQILNTIYDKACYAIADAGNNEEKVDSIIEFVKEISGIELDVKKTHRIEFRDEAGKIYFGFEIKWVEDNEEPNIEYPILKKEKDLPKDKQTRLEFREWEEYPGYIDHQSMGLLDRFLKKEKITLEEFLRNKKYFVIIDGDEYCVWDDMVKTGVIHQRKIDHIVF